MEFSQLDFLTVMVGVGVPTLTAVGIRLWSKLDDFCTRLSKLEGRHQEQDKK